MSWTALAILVFTCVLATFASIERFVPEAAVLVRGTYPLTHPDAWLKTSARERLDAAAKTQTARYPSYVP